MKLSGLVIILLAFLTPLSSLPAAADVHFHVKNCTNHELIFTTYNGHDKLASVGPSYRHFKLKGLDNASSDSAERKTECQSGCPWLESCNPRCKLRVHPNDTLTSLPIDVYKGRHIRIMDTEIVPTRSLFVPARFLVSYAVAPEERSCSDPVEHLQIAH